MARQLKTEPIDVTELPDITDKQRDFVIGVAEGLTLSDAYRRAYDAGNMTNESIWVAASVLRANDKVDIWVNWAKRTASKIECTLNDHLKTLAELREEARQSGNYGAAVQAEQLRGKVSNHYIERVEEVNKQANTDLLSAIQTVLGPDAARAAAIKLGLSTEDREQTH